MVFSRTFSFVVFFLVAIFNRVSAETHTVVFLNECVPILFDIVPGYLTPTSFLVVDLGRYAEHCMTILVLT